MLAAVKMPPSVKNDRDGECLVLFPNIIQSYSGNGKSSTQTEMGEMHTLEQEISCNNLK